MSDSQTWYDCQSCSYDELTEHLRSSTSADKESSWVFRGQLAEGELQTSLERHCQKSKIQSTDMYHAEKMVVREFRRVYDDHDRAEVMRDTLYCLSLLRHHEAPTRLLDFSYSSHVGLYFGLREAYNSIKNDAEPASFAVWCIDVKDLNEKSYQLYSADQQYDLQFKRRGKIRERDDASFEYLYGKQFDMVISENPQKIHKRLHLQQGVHLCPGNVNKSFMENLHRVYHSSITTTKVRKFVCSLAPDKLQDAFEGLRKMNITEESLFPGLDGHARSFRYALRFYTEQHKAIIGLGGD